MEPKSASRAKRAQGQFRVAWCLTMTVILGACAFPRPTLTPLHSASARVGVASTKNFGHVRKVYPHPSAGQSYSYCVGENEIIAGGGCQNRPQKWFSCNFAQTHASDADQAVAQDVCGRSHYRFYKAFRTQASVEGDACGYIHGRMTCSALPLRCSNSEKNWNCWTGSTK